MKVAIVNLITRTPLVRDRVPQVISNKDAMIVKFAQELNKLAIKSTLMVSNAYKPIKRDEELGVNIIYLNTSLKSLFPATLIPFTPELFKKLRNNYDVIVCSETFQWSTIFAILSKIFSFKKQPKIIIWQEMAMHQKIFKRLPSLIFHKFFLSLFLDRFIAKYIPRGKLAKDFLISQKIDEKKITSPISHGIDQNVFFYNPKIKKERYIFSPSRLVHKKGVDVLIKAFAIVQKRINNLELLIQGEGPKLNDYKKLSKKLNVDTKVKFCTRRLDHSEMSMRYQKALATVISSRSDNIIFSDMESIACGTVVIISNGVDSHTNFLDMKGGMVFNSEDYVQLANTIMKIVQNEPFRIRMEQKIVDTAKLYFNNYLCKEFAKIIHEVCNKRNF